MRRALGNAAPAGAIVDTSAWHSERDRLSDLLEPVDETVLIESETRRLIELLSESAPSTRSRMSVSDWDDEVSALVSEVVSAHR